MTAAAAVAAALALTISVASSAGSPPPTAFPPRAASASSSAVSINRSAPGRGIPSSFIGLGLEYRTLPAFAGEDPHAVNPVLFQLIRNLDPGQRPMLRIGGQSTDRSWWPVRGMKRSPGVTYDLTARWMAITAAFAKAVNARLILGVNLEADSTRIASAEAHALLAGLGWHRMQALEIGNEPELYRVIPWYNELHGIAIPWYLKHHGTPVLARPPGYDFTGFSEDFSRFRKALPQVPLAGPATGSYGWLTDLPQFLTVAPGLRWVTFHRYGLNGCLVDKSSPKYPSVPNLLATNASRGIMSGVGPYISLAHRHGIRFLLDELNSVTCNGRAGVSDTFASALWVLDAMFEMVSAGVDGVNIHSFQKSLNGLFDFHRVRGTWVGVVHPVYYGLLMFAQAAPPGARLLRVTASGDSSVRSWATVGRAGRVRLVLINDSLSRANSLLVREPVSSGAATLTRLQAPSAHAKTGVTLGGQSFSSKTNPPDTYTGELAGRQRIDRITPVAGAYVVRLPAATAAMLTFTPGQRAQARLSVLSAGGRAQRR